MFSLDRLDDEPFVLAFTQYTETWLNDILAMREAINIISYYANMAESHSTMADSVSGEEHA